MKCPFSQETQGFAQTNSCRQKATAVPHGDWPGLGPRPVERAVYATGGVKAGRGVPPPPKKSALTPRDPAGGRAIGRARALPGSHGKGR